MAETTRSVKMFLNLDVNAQQASKAASTFGTAVKGALGIAMTGAMGLAARSPEIRASVASMFTGATEGLKKSLGGFMGNLGVSAGTAGSIASGVGSIAGGVGKFAWNHPRIAGAALGGLGGGIPGMLGGAAPNFGRFLASSGGAAIGGAVAGPLGAIGGAAGGMMGGVGGAAAGIAIGGAASAVVALGKAALDAAGMLAGMVELTDPATAKEWHRAMADITAVLGDIFKPMLEVATNQIRGWADILAGSGDGLKDLVSALGDVAKTAFDLFVTTLKPVLPVINIALKGLAAAVNVVLWPFKKMGEAIDWVISKIPFMGGSKDASRGAAMVGSSGFSGIDEVLRNVQQTAALKGQLTKEERNLRALEEIAKNTAETAAAERRRAGERVNAETVGGQR